MGKLKFVGLFFLIIAFLSVNPIFPQADVPRGYFLINCRHSYIPDGYRGEIYFWLSDFSRAKIFPSLILHELGHIFGCGHCFRHRHFAKKTSK